MEQVKFSLRKEPKVSIIIINWNGKEDTLECLKSLQKLNYTNYEIIVVDNGSKDGSQKAIKTMYPSINLIETGQNLGFAEGNNVGIKYALEKKAQYIFLLNNDTIIAPDTLSHLITFAESDQLIGIVGPKILFYDIPNKIWFAGGKIDIRKGVIHVGINEIDNGKYDKIIESDYITGCAMLIKSTIFSNIGMLKSEYFLLFEETDLCLRAKKAGYKIFYVPDGKVWHKCSTSFGGICSPLWIYYYARNNLLFIKHNINGFLRYVGYYVAIKRCFKQWKNRGLKKHNTNAIVIGIIDFLFKRFGQRKNINFGNSLLSLILRY